MRQLLLLVGILGISGLSTGQPLSLSALDELSTRQGLHPGMPKVKVLELMSGSIEYFDFLTMMGGQYLAVFCHFDSDIDFEESPLKVVYRTDHWPMNIPRPDLTGAMCFTLPQIRPYVSNVFLDSIRPDRLYIGNQEIVRLGESVVYLMEKLGEPIPGHGWRNLSEARWDGSRFSLRVAFNSGGTITDIDYFNQGIEPPQPFLIDTLRRGTFK